MQKILRCTCLLALVVGLAYQAHAQTGNKILFDATKAEMANNADWVVDADTFNIGAGTGGIMQTGRGSEANPSRLPTPRQSTVTASTAESYWKGSLSSWGIAAAQAGLVVETLPVRGRITFNDATNAQDLSHYKVYVIDEPNIAFTAAEKNAIISWVQAGGGLFIISDHNGSDRNNDGIDSPAVLNDLIRTNTVQPYAFGWTYDLVSFSEISSNYASIPGNACLHGPYGVPRQIQISSGASMTVATAANPTVKALCYRNGTTSGSITNVLIARSYVGQGRVFGMADSSPMDDGTGDPGDQLYTGWAGEVNGDHARICMNATLWLAGITNDSTGNPSEVKPLASKTTTKLGFYPNPSTGPFDIIGPEPLAYAQLFDLSGHEVLHVVPNAQNACWVTDGQLNPGAYIVRARGRSGSTYTGRVLVVR